MEQRQSLYELRDWLFRRMVAILLNWDWAVKLKDFPKSEKRSERDNLGLAHFATKTIFLDKKRGSPRVLIHELGHVFFYDFLEKEAMISSRRELKRLKGRKKVRRWNELRTNEWDKHFFNALDDEQVKILQMFIDEARARYREDDRVPWPAKARPGNHSEKG